jgi:glycosyltransferase involved in cell wall biosynthesis
VRFIGEKAGAKAVIERPASRSRPLSEVHDSGGGYRHPSAEREEARSADPAQIEGLHVALITTMLCGRPVVATDVGPAEVIVDGVTGFLVEAPTVGCVRYAPRGIFG